MRIYLNDERGSTMHEREAPSELVQGAAVVMHEGSAYVYNGMVDAGRAAVFQLCQVLDTSTLE